MSSVTLPYPPSANRYWRNWQGRMVKSAEARAYQAKAAILARAGGLRPLAGPVAIELHAYRPRRRGDLDNLLKVVGDALNGIAWADDEQVVHINAYRHDDPARPRVELTITPAQEQSL